MSIWYSVDPDQGVAIHNSAEEAESAACENMAYYADCARDDDFWHEDIERLAWGEMIRHGRATCVAQTEPNEDHPDGTEDWALVAEPVAATCEACGCPDHINEAVAARREAIEEQYAEIERLRAQCDALWDFVGRIGAWTHVYGAALCPPGADTYGEGMRDAKDQVAALLKAVKP